MSLVVDVWKKRHRRSRVYLTAAGPEVPGIKFAFGRFFWRVPGELQLLAEGNEVHDGRRGMETTIGEGNWGLWRPLGTGGGGGPTSSTLASPRATFWRVLSTRSGRSAHCEQSDSSSATSAWARPRQAMQWLWLFSGSRADTAVECHLTGIGREGKDSDLIVAGFAFVLPLELGIFAYFVTIGQSVRLA